MSKSAVSKTAVILFNLGGPDSPDAVRPFLFNLFKDPAIIGAPAPIRYPLAAFISWRRAPVAREIYAHLGGASPLVPQTEKQAAALEAALAPHGEFKVFICMRYWHPMSDQVAREVKAYGPDHVVALPLYPQFSTTTTGSSLEDWHKASRRHGLSAPVSGPCCYPTAAGWISAQAALIRPMLETSRAATGRDPRILYSAHGLPKKIIDGGDPYAWQVERTAAAVAAALDQPNLDWRVCYQSRVGPLEWIGPSTEDEIRRAGADKVPLIVVPIAFVSEHSETLVELDVEYGHLARDAGVPRYDRVPTVQDHADFIDGLKSLVLAQTRGEAGICPGEPSTICPHDLAKCPMAKTSTRSG